MSDFAPPPGPPPPKVPEGWKAVYNEQYKEWFYVNTYTKTSQWDRPTSPVYPNSADAPPSGAPPGYDHSSGYNTGPEKGGNNPFSSQQNSTESDEAYARRLQEEENQRASSSRGQSDSYYGSGSGAPQAPQYGQGSSSYDQQLPAREQKK